jgi:Kef-type K+ transport system membrane component KefB
VLIELIRCTQVFHVLKYDISYIPLFLFQVETVAQFGVIFLLFALGLEFSTAKLRVVRAVAVLGGLLQIMLFMFLCGILATVCFRLCCLHYDLHLGALCFVHCVKLVITLSLKGILLSCAPYVQVSNN